MRLLGGQRGGAPRFFVGRGRRRWCAQNVQVDAEAFDWWQARATGGDLNFRFVPAQHNSGCGLTHRNSTLWGGWVVAHGGRRFHFAGDTAYVPALFNDIRARVGPIDLAALPIGA
jgi:L-ascorbate metabolism protein UlaG (beta-lactamase superfamily)